MKHYVQKDTTSLILQVFIQNTAGYPLTGLVFNSSGLAAYYKRNTAGAAVEISLVTATLGTFTSGGFKEIDATNMAGWYELHVPDAALATGADSVAVHLQGAANMLDLPIEIQLTDVPTELHLIKAAQVNDRLQDQSDGKAYILDDDGSTLTTQTPVGEITFTGANWTDATKRLTKTGAFTNYRHLTGRTVTLTAGTGVTTTQYTINAKIDDDTIELTADINAAGGDISDNSIDGAIQDDVIGLLKD